MRKIFKWVLKHILILVVGSVLYALSFHIDFLSVTGIYFYDGIIRLILCTIILVIADIFLKTKLEFDRKDVCLSIVCFALANMLLLSLCIISLDRSLSVFLLCYMEENETPMTEAEIDEVFDEIFINKYGMLERRFEEQQVSGNIEFDGNYYMLTERGRRIVDIFKIFADVYNTDKRFTNP